MLPWVLEACPGLWLRWVLAWGLGLSTGLSADNFPRVKQSPPEIEHYKRLERTLTLLSKSTPNRRHTVRILYYGHAFSDPLWWTNFVAYLGRSYPDARIIAENRALNRHRTEQIIRLAESELYPFRPDLVVLSTVGHSLELKRFTEQLKERTAADVLLLTDIVRTPDQVIEPTDPKVIIGNPATFKVNPTNWPAWYNNVWIPKLADDYGISYVDIRAGVKSFIRENHLEPSQLLVSNFLLTGLGHHVVGELMKPRFELPSNTVPFDPWDNAKVSTYEIPRDAAWQGNRLRLEFTGNRIEFVLNGIASSELMIQLNGMRPSEIPELRIAGRPSNIPGSPWPALLRAGRVANLLDEDWTANVTDVTTNVNGKVEFKFSLSGTKTGPDGEGSSEFDFLSKSHRVLLQTADWNLEYASESLRTYLPSSFQIKWPVLQLSRDQVKAGDKPESNLEDVLPIANGLENRRHVLELIAEGGAPKWLRAIRVYRPSSNFSKKKGR